MSGVRGTGSVPVINEKGAVSMVKVKVARYRAGVRPEYVRGEASDEEDDATAVAASVSAAVGPAAPALADSYTLVGGRPRRRVAAAVVKEEDGHKPPLPGASLRRRMDAVVLEAEEDDTDAEEDEAAMEAARQRRRLKALERLKREQEGEGDASALHEELPQAGPPGHAELAVEEESAEDEEYSSYETESEEEARPMYRPVFVKKYVFQKNAWLIRASCHGGRTDPFSWRWDNQGAPADSVGT